MSKRKVINNNQKKMSPGIALTRRRRKVESFEFTDLLQCTMVPIMTVAGSYDQVSFPDIALVSKLFEICSSGRANQKQIALECSIR